MRGRVAAAVLLAGALGAAPAAAQAPPASPSEAEVTLDRADHIGGAIGFGGPLGAAASLRFLHGLGADVTDEGQRVKAVCAFPVPHCANGFLLQADVGTGGAKLSLGVGARARVEDDDFRGTVGAGLKVSLARTWGSPVGTEPGLTYLGPELDLSILRANVSLGVLWRVSGSAGPSALFSWGVGFGL